MSSWFGTAKTQKEEDGNVTLVLNKDCAVIDQILAKEEINQENKEENTQKDATQDTQEIKEENATQEVKQEIKEENVSQDKQEDKQEPDQEESDDETTKDKQDVFCVDDVLYLDRKSPAFVLIKNRVAIGYTRTLEAAQDYMVEVAHGLLDFYENTEIGSSFYLRVPRDNRAMFVMSEDTFFAMIKHAKIRDEFRIIEMPEILGLATKAEN